MKKSALRFLVLLGLFEVALCILYGTNHRVNDPKTWSEARKHCREHYTDLSSVSNEREDRELRGMRGYWEHVWIGLHKDENDTWKWSGGEEPSFFKWSVLYNTNTEARCVAHHTSGWHNLNCKSKFHFYCFRTILVLVKENKTWEEALNYCRRHHTDLTSQDSASGVIENLQTDREAQTDHVWTGLRYLADSWLWVDGNNMNYQAWAQGNEPQCPIRSRRCGALSLKEQHWDNLDCAEKLNFVCFKST